MTSGRQSDEPIGEDVPVADAVEQRLTVGETPELSEHFQPTEASEIAAGGAIPVDANPADWQEQLTSADIRDEDCDPDIDE